VTASWTEKRRPTALKRLGILDTAPEERFDRLTNIVRRIYQVPIALISLIDDDRQWFKSNQGLEVAETPRADAFCDYTIREDKLFIVEDATCDVRFKDNPMVTGSPYIRFYAGSERVGLVGLANRTGGYSETLAGELEPLLQTVGQLIERKRLHREKDEHKKSLERTANYDSLTDLPNRRRLTELFEQEIVEADRRQGIVSVCFIDLDGFKDINDGLGHSAGDFVLKEVAGRLKESLREHDVIARLGGDEFVAILRDVEDDRVYERMLEAIRAPITIGEYVFELSGSMGVTVYPDDNVNIDLLLRHADQAMYAAKESGKNQFRHFDLESHVLRKERDRVLEQTRWKCLTNGPAKGCPIL